MLDIIIPVYNNPSGLFNTLMSIGPYGIEDFQITVIDDGSQTSYRNIITLFQPKFNIQYYKLEHNQGPAFARRAGIEKTSDSYLMFLDCGDLMYSTLSISKLLNTIKENPEMKMLSSLFLMEMAVTEDGNTITGTNFFESNRRHLGIHGKVYKRSFLNKYNLNFPTTDPYHNEDVAFNSSCFFCIDLYEPNALFYLDEPTTIWTRDITSITRQDDNAFYYSVSNIGAALNCEESLTPLFKNADIEFVRKEIYDTFCDFYFIYLSALNRRPELAPIAYKGVLYWYQTCFENLQEHDPQKLLDSFYHSLMSCLQDREDALYDKFISLDIIKFLDECAQQPKLNKEDLIDIIKKI